MGELGVSKQEQWWEGCTAQGGAEASDSGEVGQAMGWREDGEGPGTQQWAWESPPWEEEELAAGQRGNVGTREEVALERFPGWEERSELQSRTQTRICL